MQFYLDEETVCVMAMLAKVIWEIGKKEKAIPALKTLTAKQTAMQRKVNKRQGTVKERFSWSWPEN